jgi:hypothetical protein
VVLCDELSRQTRFYRASRSRLLKVAALHCLSGKALDEAAAQFLGGPSDDSALDSAIQNAGMRATTGTFTDARLDELLRGRSSVRSQARDAV